MKKLIFMLIVLPILLFAGANLKVDSTAWDTVAVFRVAPFLFKQQGYEYVSLFLEIDIDSAGTTMVWNPISTGKFNAFSLDIPAKGDSLRIEYFPGIQLTDITNYPYRWEVDTTSTGTDSTYRNAIFYEKALFLYGWVRFINLTLADKTDVPVIMSGKEQ